MGVFFNSLDSYLDCVNKFDHQKILADLDAEI